MIRKGLLCIFLFVHLFSSLQAEEQFRIFKTPSGKSFEGKVVGYEGQTFILTNKSNQLFQVPFNALSTQDKAYLVEAVKANRIPKGRPAPQTVTTTPASSSGNKGVDFHSEIMPILQQRCNECHKAPYEENGRTKNPKAGLRFDSYDWLMKGNDDGPVIKSENTDESILFEVITLPPDDDMVMPPKGDPLSAEQIDLFRRWILEGALEKPSGKVISTAVAKSPEPSSEEKAESKDNKIHKSPPKKKLTFRPGSFFAHVVVPLGISPDEAFAKIQGAKPKPGEPIDFDKHVLPILEDRCNSCHHAPFDRSGRLVNPKASLRFDSFDQVMKGNLDGPVIVPNDLEKSRLYTVLNLPEDDDLFMPPKGGPMDSEQKDVIKRWIEEGAKPSKNSVSATKGGIPAADEPVSFKNHILPLFEKRCMECHGEPYVKNGRTIKPRAGLQLDTHEMVLKGNLDGTIVTPGDPADSALYQVIMLPEDDPEIMPPKGDPLSEEQKTMVKRWILEGASEDPAAVAADPNALPKPKINTELVAGTASNKLSHLDMLSKKASLPSKTQLLAAEKTGALVTQLSERNTLVRAEFSSFAGEINDSALSAFGSIKNNISHLDVSRTKVTDAALRAAGGMQNLTWLSARNTIVGDNGLKSLSSLQNLTYLNLSGTKVTDSGLKSISSLKSLKEIYLWGSEVTENGVKSLREDLPEAKIIF